jgi:hypothetical protein
MFCAIGSDAAAGFAASAAGASGSAADEIAGRGAASLSATRGAEDVDVVVAVAVDGESSAPQALNAKLASAISAMLARRLSLLMSASGFVKASAVSNPFKK